MLSNIVIPVYSDMIKPAVKIGREAGYSALRSIELTAARTSTSGSSEQCCCAI